MTLRFHIFLLSVASLVLLNACGTTAPVPVEKPVVVVEQPGEPEISKSDIFDLQYLMQKHPADRSLAETTELSRQMSSYQPDIALQVLRSLESIPSAQLAAMIEEQTSDPEFTEWLELALQSRRVLIGQTSANDAARNWANYHYGHAITEADFSDLMNRYGRLYSVPARVAVLLPTEGGLSSAARAIRDGIMSAYLEQPGNTVLRFYSSGSDSETAIAAYLQAREDGATQIIGPLRSASAGALASLNDPSVPILLLNQPTESSSDPIQKSIIKSLSLLQNEEAMAIAEKALSQGQRRVIVIAADSPWGRRMQDAFTSTFEAGDGQVAAATRFSSVSEEYSAMLTRLLKIDESKQRKADLQSWLGTSLNFEPSQRDDFDFIFLAAGPKQGRELKPLLRFHDAGDIPVFAMGRIFSGRKERASNQDLNGIVFPVTHWQLQTAEGELPPLESIRDGSFGNLFALGQDAWHVLPWLPLMEKDPDLRFPGEVGSLRMKEDGHLERAPAWAQFSAGQPVPFEWPDKP